MGKVGVVGHSVYFKVYTAKDDYWTQKFDSIHFNHYPDEDYSVHLKNCEVYPDLTLRPLLDSHSHKWGWSPSERNSAQRTQ